MSQPRIPNPYTPGFNQTPETLAGRDEVLEDLTDALQTAALDARTPPPVLLVGPRGVGKTVLLGEVGARAGAEYGWPHVHVEVRPGVSFIANLAGRLDDARRLLDQQRPGRGMRAQSATVRAQLAGVGGEVHFERPTPNADPDVELAGSMAALATTAIEHQSGFVVTVDEMHLADRAGLGEFAAVLQEGTGRGWPVVVVAAGLAAMRDAQRAVTYFERAVWHELGLLAYDDAVRALVGPAEHAGRPMDTDAAQLLADASGRYPYAIQLYGHHAWRTSAQQPRIGLDAAKAALAPAQRQLERGLYASRWTTAPPSHKLYMAAIAGIIAARRQPTGRAVAEHLGRDPKQLSRVRDELLRNGTLTAEGETLAFTIPAMSDYVLRQPQPRAGPAAIPTARRTATRRVRR